MKDPVTGRRRITRSEVVRTTRTGPRAPAASLKDLAHELVRLQRRLVDLERDMRLPLRRVDASKRESAKNLVHYVALRQQDLRNLQSGLAERGLSSLGRSESCVMRSVLEASTRAHESLALTGDPSAQRRLSRLVAERETSLSWEAANRSLHEHTREVLGARPDGRHIYVMVTAPSAREADRPWMVKMLRAGMNVLRINCAHESEREWDKTIRALRGARAETGRKCPILMDLAGPKIRTGPVALPHRIAKWKPTKNELGRVAAPARVIIRRATQPQTEKTEPFLMVADGALTRLREGDELRFRDARGKRRALRVRSVEPDEIGATADETFYLLDRVRAKVHRGRERVGSVTLEVSDTSDAAVDVKAGDELMLDRRATHGRPPRRGSDGRLESPGGVTCTLPAALDHLAKGQRVVFDDGRIHAVVKQVLRDSFLLRVVRTEKETVKLRAEKGINLPDTQLTMRSLTADDRRALPFIAKHADAVSLSFVRTPEDIRMLHAALDRLGRRNIAVVLKIEKREGFENLPRLLLEGLRRPPLAVMIARGDLAVEVGFERLAELQEEILWLCEAAHVPTIWATQVLDTLARTGFPSRAEVTDAAASVAAECVMLNKGPFVDEAVRMLTNIVGRMEKHRYKKRSLFRELSVSTFVKRAAHRS
jgi:pyruvate kinase